MAPSELRLVKWGRCPSCGRTGFLWARSPRARVKRCLVCATKDKGESHASRHDGP